MSKKKTEGKKPKMGEVRNEEIYESKKKAVLLAEKHSPDLSKLQKVRIDDNTYIYIGLDKDPKKAKKRFIERHIENGRYGAKYYNYKCED